MGWTQSQSRLVSCAFGLFAVLAGAASAQDFRGAVARVTDSSGAVLPGVTVTVTNKDTKVTTDTVTNETGTYSLLHQQPGPAGMKVIF